MYKKSRLARLKQRVHGKKQLVRRKMARQLLSGTLSLAQVEERDPEGLSKILRTVAYLNESEGSEIPSAIAPAVSHALAPATFGASIPQVSRGPKVTTGRQGSSSRVSKAAVANENTEPIAQEEVQPPAPKRRRAASAKSETSVAEEMGGATSVTGAPKKTTTTRSAKKPNAGKNTESASVAKEETASPNRRSAKAPQSKSTTGDVETPVTPRQSKRQSSKPKADEEN